MFSFPISADTLLRQLSVHSLLLFSRYVTRGLDQYRFQGSINIWDLHFTGTAITFPHHCFLGVFRCCNSPAQEATQHLYSTQPKFPSELSGIQEKTVPFTRLSLSLLLHQPLLIIWGTLNLTHPYVQRADLTPFFCRVQGWGVAKEGPLVSRFLPCLLHACKDLSDMLGLTMDQHLLNAEFLLPWNLDPAQTEQFLLLLSNCILEWVRPSLSYGSDQALIYESALQMGHTGLGHLSCRCNLEASILYTKKTPGHRDCYCARGWQRPVPLAVLERTGWLRGMRWDTQRSVCFFLFSHSLSAVLLFLDTGT